MMALLWLLMIGPAAAAGRVLLVMGDSLAAAYGLRAEQGWVALLGDRLQQDGHGWTVVNASVSGETTAGGASRIDSELTRHRPDAVIIELGANDGLRGLPVELAERNLQKMIDASRAADAEVLLVGMRMPPNYGPDYTRQFEAMYRGLSERNEVALLPFLLEPIAADRDAFLGDNLHPTAEAQPQLLEHLWPALQPLIEAQP